MALGSPAPPAGPASRSIPTSARPEPGTTARRALPNMDASGQTDAPIDVQIAEPLLTAGQVAELLAVPRSSVYEYARRLHDPLPSIAVGRHRRFYRSDIEVWLAAQRVGSAARGTEVRTPATGRL